MISLKKLTIFGFLAVSSSMVVAGQWVVKNISSHGRTEEQARQSFYDQIGDNGWPISGPNCQDILRPPFGGGMWICTGSARFYIP
ncbi:hypothetical protein GCM10009092_34530 [Bowmanella denitrificans]|uniref:Secreted protein n=1 Tax=Bowmanella denitrificans TaxID=366582 RepID=A0ABN0XLG7_9ALTE